jgi:metal-responsive CopG/Arc/MetJ family transcriptional regulator
MRTLVDIPDRQLDELAAISVASKMSRAEIIRRAIASNIEHHRPNTDDAFGIWAGAAEEGVAYQERMRSEW